MVGIRDGRAEAVPFQPLDGVPTGCPAVLRSAEAGLAVGDGWLGRVVDPLGRPLDGGGPLPPGPFLRPVRGAPPEAGRRGRLGPRLDLGVRALDAFATCRRGQRLGLFAASGVGKSTLLSMLASGADCDVAVLALVGERGRELREFIEDDLGPEGLRRSVVVCATSDSTALMRREAAYAAMTVAEHFADRGKQVLLLMDTVTRFAMASCRGCWSARGRGRRARRAPSPAFSPCWSRATTMTSRSPMRCAASWTGTWCSTGASASGVGIRRSMSCGACRAPCRGACCRRSGSWRRARRLLSVQAEMADLVRLGAYRAGTDPAVDEALRLAPRIEAVLAQGKGERRGTVEGAFAALAAAMEDDGGEAA